jgi:hypothetical protein
VGNPAVFRPLARTSSEDYNNVIMATGNLESPSVSEMCAHVKHLGYAAPGRIRLYGEEFEVVSDPFPEDDGIAVHVKTKSNSTVRVLQLPATVVQSVKRRRPKAA